VADDTVYAGFLLTASPDASVSVVPRTWRLVCCNGAVRAVEDWPASARGTPDIDGAIRQSLDRGRFTETVEKYRMMSKREVVDATALLSDVGVSASSLPRVLRRFEGSDDQSHWGLFNAITIEAKLGANWGERLSREYDAARLAALVCDARL